MSLLAEEKLFEVSFCFVSRRLGEILHQLSSKFGLCRVRIDMHMSHHVDIYTVHMYPSAVRHDGSLANIQ